MQWLRAHPYLALMIGALFLLIIGSIVVVNRSGIEPQDSARVWGSIEGYLLNPVTNTARPELGSDKNLYTDVRSGPPFYYAPDPAQIPVPQRTAEDFDFEEFLASLAGPSRSSTAEVEGGVSLDAYSFIPGGLISTSTSGKKHTPLQQALFSYGNEVGSTIETYEERYRNGAQILKDQFEDREDEGKKNALLSLAGGMRAVGAELLAMETVPSEMKAANERLAASYDDMGKKLAQVPASKNDESLLQAMLAYNAAVETFTKSYIALATLLSAHGVLFAPDDPGSVFTFTQGSF